MKSKDGKLAMSDIHIIEASEHWTKGLWTPNDKYLPSESLVVYVAGILNSYNHRQKGPPEIDIACARAVVALNRAGYLTSYCCSGVMAHHRNFHYDVPPAPYCAINGKWDDDEILEVMPIIKRCGFTLWEDWAQPQDAEKKFVFRMFNNEVARSIERPGDDVIIQAWDDLTIFIESLTSCFFRSAIT